MGLYSINMDSFDGCIRQHDLTLFNPGMPEHTAGCWAAAILWPFGTFCAFAVSITLRSGHVAMTNVRQQYVLPGKHTAVTGLPSLLHGRQPVTPWNLFIVSIVVEADSFTRAGCSDGNGILWDISGSEPHSRIFGFGYNVSVWRSHHISRGPDFGPDFAANAPFTSFDMVPRQVFLAPTWG